MIDEETKLDTSTDPQGRLEALVSDAERLAWLMMFSGIDGIASVPKDRYEYACECAFERT